MTQPKPDPKAEAKLQEALKNTNIKGTNGGGIGDLEAAKKKATVNTATDNAPAMQVSKDKKEAAKPD